MGPFPLRIFHDSLTLREGQRQAGVGSHTLGQQEVGHERALERGLPELEPVWDLPEEQLHHDEQLVHLGQSETLSESPQGLKPSLCTPRGLAPIPVGHMTPGDPKFVPVPVEPGRSQICPWEVPNLGGPAPVIPAGPNTLGGRTPVPAEPNPGGLRSHPGRCQNCPRGAQPWGALDLTLGSPKSQGTRLHGA